MIARYVWLLAVTSALAASAPFYDDYTDTEPAPEKRAALVLDRLFVALQRALHEESLQEPPPPPPRLPRDLEGPLEGPWAAPLRVAPLYVSHMNTLQRRGQAGPGRGRILRCYFNAITCF